MDEESRFEIGGNNPPNPQGLLQEKLLESTMELRNRYDELIEALPRVPAQCDDDETAGKMGDFVKLLTSCQKAFETKRVGEKEPYLSLSRSVDGFFKKYTETLETSAKKISDSLGVYLRRKEAERRKQAEEAARLQREESERLAREAEMLAKANMPEASNDALGEAVRAEELAQKSEKQAEAKPAELAHTRGDYGSLATLRTVWVGEIVDKKAVDLESLRPFMSDDVLQKLVNAAVKAGFRELRGVKIFERSDAMVR